jgi:hypothetical protein
LTQAVVWRLARAGLHAIVIRAGPAGRRLIGGLARRALRFSRAARDSFARRA